MTHANRPRSTLLDRTKAGSLMRICTAAIIVFAGPLAAALAADPVPVSIERGIEASSEIQADFSQERLLERNSFFSFDSATIDEQVMSSKVLAGSITEAHATQVSSFSPDAFSIEGSVAGFSSNGGDLFICQSVPVSVFDYTFDLDEPSPYRISGRLDATDGGVVLVSLAAAFLGPTEFSEIVTCPPNPGPVCMR